MKKILNFGSLNLDHVYRVSHFVMPGETLATDSYACHMGGKGLNQSVALARAGAEVYHAGKIGPDGNDLMEMLASYGVDTRYVAAAQGKTGHAMIQVDTQGQNCILLHGGANQAIEKADIDRVLDCFGRGDMLVMQNEISNADYLLRTAKAAGLYIVMNPSPITKELLGYPLECVDVFVLNEIEAEMLTGEKEKARMGQAMEKLFPKAAVMLTLGKEGSEYHENGSVIRQTAFQVKEVDTTAAGDTFLGFFSARIALGDSVREAIRIASAASALAVTRRGAAQSIPSYDEAVQMLM